MMDEDRPTEIRDSWTPRLRQLHGWLTGVIPCHPDTPGVRAELRSKGLNDAVGAYMNWVDRYIPPRPRKVMVWDGFWVRNNPYAHAEKLDALIKLMWEGGDLAPYLSRYVSTHGFEAERSRKGIQWQNAKTGHKDFALNAYDTHHLHLIPSDASGRCVFRRSRPVIPINHRPPIPISFRPGFRFEAGHFWTSPGSLLRFASSFVSGQA